MKIRKVKSKYLLIILAILSISSLVIFTYQKTDQLELYGVMIYQAGGIDSRDFVAQAYELKSLDSEVIGKELTPVENYASVSFNESNELWVSCKEGYGVISAGSVTENQVLNNPEGHMVDKVGMRLTDQSASALGLACEPL